MTTAALKQKPKQTATPNREAQIQERLAQMPPRYQKLYLKALAGNRPAAVRAQCLECVGWVKEEVRLCTDAGCPLYTIRPYQKA